MDHWVFRVTGSGKRLAGSHQGDETALCTCRRRSLTSSTFRQVSALKPDVPQSTIAVTEAASSSTARYIEHITARYIEHVTWQAELLLCHFGVAELSVAAAPHELPSPC